MAGGGVGEAMLIGAAVGAGTGAIGSAVQDKDPLQGALLGAVGGAATGGLGSAFGGAGSAAATAGEQAVEQGTQAAMTDAVTSSAVPTAIGGEAPASVMGDTGINALYGPSSTSASAGANNILSPNYGLQSNLQGAASMSGQGAQNAASTYGAAGMPVNPSDVSTAASQSGGIANLTPAQISAAKSGAISGAIGSLGASQDQSTPPGQEPYTGPLSKFKMAGPSLSQYNYDPNSFRPSVAPGYAQGGIASLDRMQFATPSMQPTSPEVIYSDYDQRVDPYTGDMPRYADGGGINFIHNLQPGGEFGDITSDIYGVVQEHKPQWLQDMEPGGFIGATVPGKLDWEEKKRKEEEEKIAQDRAAKEAQAAAMYNQLAQQGKMARGGIADLGSYSDGGRLLRGPGDGMSDNIPATIAGKQPARLADGEFVVPADVVSGLGNGSTDAGAKTLYSMMNKVRKARTGTTRQGKEINSEKYMPKMAQGGDVTRYAAGNLVVNPDTNEVGYWTGQNEWGGGGTWNPYSVSNASSSAATTSPTYTPSIYTPDPRYSAYTVANRPSATEPQFYGNIYRGSTPDYSTPGYTLTGGNLGRWSNVAGEQQRAAQPASLNQQVTQSFLQNLGRAPDQNTFNQYMQSGMSAPQINRALAGSQESIQRDPTNQANISSYLADMYQQSLGRTPEQGGQDFWSKLITSGGMKPGDVTNTIQNSPEAQIHRMYDQYLGRTADQPGQQFWTEQASKGMTLDQIKAAMQGSEEGKAYTAKQAESKTEKKRRGGIASLV